MFMNVSHSLGQEDTGVYGTAAENSKNTAHPGPFEYTWILLDLEGGSAFSRGLGGNPESGSGNTSCCLALPRLVFRTDAVVRAWLL